MRQLPVNELINRHADLGGQLQPFVIGLAVAAVVLLVLTSPKLADKRTNVVLIVVSVLTRYPDAPSGGGRPGELLRHLDVSLRQSPTGRP